MVSSTLRLHHHSVVIFLSVFTVRCIWFGWHRFVQLGSGLFERNACTTFLLTKPYTQSPMLYIYCRPALECTICGSHVRVCAVLQSQGATPLLANILMLRSICTAVQTNRLEANRIVDIKDIVPSEIADLATSIYKLDQMRGQILCDLFPRIFEQ